MKTALADLHTHSLCSDGTFTPEQLVGKAVSAGITLMALTDHDCIDGLDRAVAAARGTPLVLIPGIEIEVAFQPGEFHLLGLGLKNWQESTLTRRLQELIRVRNERNRKMLTRIQEDGVPMRWEELVQVSGGQVIARPHFARLLVHHGKAKNPPDAFERFLRPGGPYYTEREALPPEEAIRLIRESGGLPVVAHPLSLHVSWGRLPALLSEWKEMGLGGIEAYHSGARLNQAHRLAALARELGLAVTGGSDYHGPDRKERKLGYGPGDKPLRADDFRAVVQENSLIPPQS